MAGNNWLIQNRVSLFQNALLPAIFLLMAWGIRKFRVCMTVISRVSRLTHDSEQPCTSQQPAAVFLDLSRSATRLGLGRHAESPWISRVNPWSLLKLPGGDFPTSWFKVGTGRSNLECLTLMWPDSYEARSSVVWAPEDRSGWSGL